MAWSASSPRLPWAVSPVPSGRPLSSPRLRLPSPLRGPHQPARVTPRPQQQPPKPQCCAPPLRTRTPSPACRKSRTSPRVSPSTDQLPPHRRREVGNGGTSRLWVPNTTSAQLRARPGAAATSTAEDLDPVRIRERARSGAHARGTPPGVVGALSVRRLESWWEGDGKGCPTPARHRLTHPDTQDGGDLQILVLDGTIGTRWHDTQAPFNPRVVGSSPTGPTPV